ETGGIKLSKARIGGGQQPAIVQTGANVAAASGAQSAAVKTLANFDDALPHFQFSVHLDGPRSRHAFTRKSSEPKFPDFSARAILRFGPEARVQGTPGSISGPMRKRFKPSFVTTAPAVSPPATINCDTSSSINFSAIAARNLSQRSPERS